jgi:hypothetical protein
MAKKWVMTPARKAYYASKRKGTPKTMLGSAPLVYDKAYHKAMMKGGPSKKRKAKTTRLRGASKYVVGRAGGKPVYRYTVKGETGLTRDQAAKRLGK